MPSEKGKLPPKTTPKHFELFRKHFNAHIEKLGLFGWRVYFKHEQLHDTYANTSYNVNNRIVSVKFGTEWCCPLNNKCNYDLNEESIKIIAKHEANHVLLAKVFELAMNRFVEKRELEEAEEEIVRILDRFL